MNRIGGTLRSYWFFLFFSLNWVLPVAIDNGPLYYIHPLCHKLDEVLNFHNLFDCTSLYLKRTFPWAKKLRTEKTVLQFWGRHWNELWDMIAAIKGQIRSTGCKNKSKIEWREKIVINSEVYKSLKNSSSLYCWQYY